MSLIVGLLVRALGLVGLSLSPFWGGAIVAFSIVAAIGGAGIYVYGAGEAAADQRWEAKALQAQLAAVTADLTNSKRASADADRRVAAIEAETAAKLKGTADYVVWLQTHQVVACLATDDDVGWLLGHGATGAIAGRPKPAWPSWQSLEKGGGAHP